MGVVFPWEQGHSSVARGEQVFLCLFVVLGVENSSSIPLTAHKIGLDSNGPFKQHIKAWTALALDTPVAIASLDFCTICAAIRLPYLPPRSLARRSQRESQLSPPSSCSVAFCDIVASSVIPSIPISSPILVADSTSTFRDAQPACFDNSVQSSSRSSNA